MAAIELRTGEGWSDVALAALAAAAAFWNRVIVDPLPAVRVDGACIQGLRIDCHVYDGGQGGELARAGPLKLRPHAAGPAKLLPATAVLELDRHDIQTLADQGRLGRVLIHEMGHALGVGGAVWTFKGLIKGAGGGNPTFGGPAAMREYGNLLGSAAATPVPLESEGSGAKLRHWRETVFGDELMSTRIQAANPLSRLTIASLEDLGYAVDYNCAEPYALPPPGGRLESHIKPYKSTATLPAILHDEALVPGGVCG